MPDIKALKKRVRESLAVRDFVPYHGMREVVRRAEGVNALIEELLNSGRNALAAELADYAMQRGIKAYANMDDSDGFFGGLLEELAEWHLRALTGAGSAYPLKGRHFFKLKQLDDWGFFPFPHYAPLLSDKEYAEYRKLAQVQWDKVPAVSPDEGRQKPDSNYGNYRIRSIVEELARYEQDVDQLVTVKSRDLGSAYRFLEIAEILHRDKRDDEALVWAERGIAAFKNELDGRLVDFTAAAYQRRLR